VHQATGVARLLQFPIESVPQTFLAFPDQTDVGLSGLLQTGICFFGHPKAAPAALMKSRITDPWVKQSARTLKNASSKHENILVHLDR